MTAAVTPEELKADRFVADIAKHRAARKEEQREAQEKGDYLSARHFKTRRYQRLK